ncbi:hypothetical protein KC319_g49 [Hortaea werneckii]|nr:hypothetical protein KC319_g49 [Hortaea werneckii]
MSSTYAMSVMLSRCRRTSFTSCWQVAGAFNMSRRSIFEYQFAPVIVDSRLPFVVFLLSLERTLLVKRLVTVVSLSIPYRSFPSSIWLPWWIFAGLKLYSVIPWLIGFHFLNSSGISGVSVEPISLPFLSEYVVG